MKSRDHALTLPSSHALHDIENSSTSFSKENHFLLAEFSKRRRDQYYVVYKKAPAVR
jgi:hypothetical protein